jgi:hypothetical protein
MDDHPSNIDDAVENPKRGLGTRDVRLLGLALRERWPMSVEAREVAIKRLEKVIADPQAKPRAFQTALRSLMALSRINLEVVTVAVRARQDEELSQTVMEIKGKLERIERERRP